MKKTIFESPSNACIDLRNTIKSNCIKVKFDWSYDDLKFDIYGHEFYYTYRNGNKCTKTIFKDEIVYTIGNNTIIINGDKLGISNEIAPEIPLTSANIDFFELEEQKRIQESNKIIDSIKRK